MFNFFKKPTPVIKGSIGYYGLTDWWLSTFTEEERNHILQTFQPLGGSSESLIKGEIISTSQTAISLLSALAGWFNNDRDRTIAYRILKKAEDLITDKTDILDIHFLFSSRIKIYYRNRNRDQYALKEAIQGCKQQISIAPQVASAFKKDYDDRHNKLKTGFNGDLELWDNSKQKYVKGRNLTYSFTLPSHTGYEQLAIILEKQKKYKEAINLIKQAQSEGWNGDWDKRIERCQKKASSL